MVIFIYAQLDLSLFHRQQGSKPEVSEDMDIIHE